MAASVESCEYLEFHHIRRSETGTSSDKEESIKKRRNNVLINSVQLLYKIIYNISVKTQKLKQYIIKHLFIKDKYTWKLNHRKTDLKQNTKFQLRRHIFFYLPKRTKNCSK